MERRRTAGFAPATLAAFLLGTAAMPASAETVLKVMLTAVVVGGVNIFGKGFGNYDQDIVMRLYLRRNGARP